MFRAKIDIQYISLSDSGGLLVLVSTEKWNRLFYRTIIKGAVIFDYRNIWQQGDMGRWLFNLFQFNKDTKKIAVEMIL